MDVYEIVTKQIIDKFVLSVVTEFLKGNEEFEKFCKLYMQDPNVIKHYLKQIKDKIK